MATVNLDKPLNDIIKEGRKAGRGAARGAARGGGRGRGRGAPRAARGGVAPRRGGGGGAVRGRGGSRPRAAPVQQRGAANGSGPIRRARGSSLRSAAASPYQRPPTQPCQDPQLTEDDCLEIFQKCGPVTRAVIHYNRDGSSQGTAEVHFANKNDALRAVDEYDAAQIDGRPMYVKVIANKAPTVVQRAPVVAAPQQSVPFPSFRGRPERAPRARGGTRPARGGAAAAPAARGGATRRGSAPRGAGGRGAAQGSRGARGARGARGGARGRGRGRRDNKAVPSAEALDAEMDHYHGSVETDLLAAGQPANPTVAPKQ